MTLSGAAAAAELGAKELKELEQMLAQLNFDPGPVDGVVDEHTRTAIRLYQEFAALPQDGEPTEALLGELRAVTQAYSALQAARAAEGPAKPQPKAAKQPPVAAEQPPSTPPAAQAPAAEAPVAQEPAAKEPAAQEQSAQEPTAPEPAPVVESPEPAKEEAARPSAAVAPAGSEPAAKRPAAGKPNNEPTAALGAAPLAAPLKEKAEPPAPKTEPTAPAAQPSAPAASAPAPSGAARPKEPAAPTPQKPLARAAPARPAPKAQRSFDLEGVIARLVGRDRGEKPAPGGAVAPAAQAPAAQTPQQTQGAAVANRMNGYEAYTQGFAEAGKGNFEGAIALYSAAIDSGDLSLEHLADALFDRGNAYHYLNEFDKAIADYDAAIADQPDFAAAYYNRGFARQAVGQDRRAVDDFKQARDLGLQRLGVRAPDVPPPFR